MTDLCSTLQSLNTNLLSESESEVDDVLHTKRSILAVTDFRRRQESTSSDGTDRMFIPRSRDKARSSSCDGRSLPDRANYFHCRCCGKWKQSELPVSDSGGGSNHLHITDQADTDPGRPGWKRSRDIQAGIDGATSREVRERGKPPPAPYTSSPAMSPSLSRHCQPTTASSPSLSRGPPSFASSPASSPSLSRSRQPSPVRHPPASVEASRPTRDLVSRSSRSGSLERPEVRETDGEDNWWASPREPDVDSRTSESVHSFDSDITDGSNVPIELVPSFIPEAFPRRSQSQSLDRVPRPRNDAWCVEKENERQDCAKQNGVIPQSCGKQQYSRFHQQRQMGEHASDRIRSVSDYDSRSDTDSSVQHGPTAPSLPLTVTRFQKTQESFRTELKPPIPRSKADTVSNTSDQAQIRRSRAGSYTPNNSRSPGLSSTRHSKPADLQQSGYRVASPHQRESSNSINHLPPRAPVRMLLVNRSPPSSTYPPSSHPRDAGGNPSTRSPKSYAPTCERGRDRSISPPTEKPPPVPPRGRPPVHPERVGTRVSRQDVNPGRSLKELQRPTLKSQMGKSFKNDKHLNSKDFDNVDALVNRIDFPSSFTDSRFPPQRPPKSWKNSSGPAAPSLATGSNKTDTPPPLPPRARRSQSVDSVFNVRGPGTGNAVVWGTKDGGGSDQRRTASEGDNQKLIVEVLV